MSRTGYKTVSLNAATVEKEWLLVDAENEVLGRLSSRVALLLRGKHKPGFTPHVDCGDNVVVINAEKVRLTGKKMKNKEYIRYTGYPGGQRTTTPARLLDKKPEAIIEMAVKGMLPGNRLGNRLFHNLHVYAGAAHKHAGQNPRPISLSTIR